MASSQQAVTASTIELDALKHHIAMLEEENKELRRRDAALSNSENQSLELFETMREGVLFIDSDLNIIGVNPAAEQILGITSENLIGLHASKDWDATHEDGTPFEEQDLPVVKAFDTGLRVADVTMGINDPRGSSRRWILVNAIPQYRGDEPDPYQVFLTFSDVTERKRVEDERALIQSQLVQAAKLATVGTLSAGIAHELNNPLAAIMGFADIIITLEGNQPDKVVERARKIKASATRMRKIIDHLRQFARESKDSDWEEVDMGEPVKDALILLETNMRNRNIGVRLQAGSQLPAIWGNRVQLESIFQNLFTNSIDAFESIKDDRKKLIQIDVSATRRFITVVYQDNAGGMSEDVRGRVFDPFFTTKSVDKGTGLGMSVTHGIVKDHRGDVSVDSAEGDFTRFTFRLPLLKDN